MDCHIIISVNCILDMPVLPHVRSIGPGVARAGDDPAISEVLGARHRASSAVKAGRRVVADTNVVRGPRTGVVTVGYQRNSQNYF